MKIVPERIISIIRNKNLIPKVVCLLLSFMLWSYLSFTSMGEIKFRILLDYSRLPGKYSLLDKPRKYVIAKLEGKKEHLRNVNIKNIRAFVDFEKPALDSTVKYRIRIIKNEIPEGIRIKLDNKYIELTVEKKIQKMVRVIPNIKGDVTEGFVVGKTTIKPDAVRVVGPESRLKDLEFVYTEAISVSGLSANTVREVPLKMENLKNIKVSETNFRINIPIIEYGNLYSVNAPILFRNILPSYDYKLNVSNVKIYYKSPGKIKVSEYDIDTSVDVSRIDVKKMLKDNNTFSKEMPVKILFRNNIDGVEIVSVVPEKVVVNIKRK